MEQESDAIRNIFEPNLPSDIHKNASQEETIAFNLAWAAHCDVMGGQYIVTKTDTDFDCFYMQNMETGKRFKVNIVADSNT